MGRFAGFPQVVEQDWPLPQRARRRRMVHHVAVRDENVLGAVVVVVNETAAPADVDEADGTDAGRRACMPKRLARTTILVQRMRLVLIVGYEDGEIPRAIVIGGINAHAAIRDAILVPGGVELRRRLDELDR